MSDVSQGHGWWQASDGKWYPPEQHPNAAPAAPPPPSPGSWAPADQGWGTHMPPAGQPGAYGAPYQQPAPAGPPPQQQKSNKGLWIGLAAVVIIPIVGVWGCIALVREGTEAAVTGAADAVGDAVDEGLNSNDATAEGGGEAGTEEDPLPVGTEADLGNGWRVTVNSANLDATAEVVAADDFNSEPDEGMRYVAVELTLTLDAEADREAPVFGVDLGLWGSDQIERSDNTIGVSLADGIDWMSEMAPGTSVTAREVFEVGAAETDLVLLAEPTLSFDRSEAWLALQ